MDNDKRLVPESSFNSDQPTTEATPFITTPAIATPGVPATTANEPAMPFTVPQTSGGLVPDAGATGGGLGRPVPPQRRIRPIRHKRSNPWGWLFIILLGVVAGIGAFLYTRSTQTSTTFQGLTTAASKGQAVTLAVSATGQIQANADVALSFGSGGTVTAVKAKQGDKVTRGQELAKIDDSDLQTAVKTAKASLEQQQANLSKVTEGATEKDIAIAQASLKQAQIKFQQTKFGNATPQDIANAQAALRSAQAKLSQDSSGPTSADSSAAQSSINSAQAQLASAQAKYNQDKQGGSPADIASAQSAISSAQANLASAQAKLAKDQAGPDTATVVSAQAKVDQAQASSDKTKNNLQNAIYSAQTARTAALNTLHNAQDNYQNQFNNNHNPDGSLKSGLKQSDIDTETNLFRALQDAQANYNKADIALNDAKANFDAGVRTATSQLQDAQAQLDKVKAGPTPADIAADQASVAQAQSAVETAKKNQVALTATDATLAADVSAIASAQSAVDSARKNLASLSPTDATLAADQASVAAAQANLTKLQGGTLTDVANAQASVDSANATLSDLLNGAKPNDIAVAQAQVNSAQATLDSKILALKNAVITAPFDGILTSAIPVVGQLITPNAAMFQIVDNSSLHVDVNVGENDISKIKPGQAAAVNLDAISGRSFTGKITYISSKSTVTNNVVNFLVTVTLDTPPANSFNDVWGTELTKYFQSALGGQNRSGQNRPGQGTGAAGQAAGTTTSAARTTTTQATGNPLPGQAGATGGLAGGAAGNGQRIPAAFLSQVTACGYLPSFGNAAAASQDQPKVGMTANVTVCQDFKAGVLSVPNRALKTKTENGRRIQFVQVLVDKDSAKIEDRPVLTGLVGDNYTEITGGNLSENDQLVLSTTPTNRSTTTTGLPGGGGGGGGAPGGGGRG